MGTPPTTKLHTFQIHSPRKRTEGLRIGTVRFLPHGVKKKDYAKHDYFDVWLPSVAPSRELIRWYRSTGTHRQAMGVVPQEVRTRDDRYRQPPDHSAARPDRQKDSDQYWVLLCGREPVPQVDAAEVD